MSERDRFSDDEWRTLVAATGSAVMAIIAANHSGVIAMFKELRAVGKEVKHEQPGEWAPVVGELITHLRDHSDDMASGSEPNADFEATYQQAMEQLGLAGSVATKLSPDELDSYVQWVIGLATVTADSVTEKGESSPISDAEQAVITEIERRLRGS